jgi:hypothetical protein
LQLFSAWSERQAHLTRWVLLVGWLALIGTLLIPGFDPWPLQIGGCEAITACHSHEGNHLFWGSVVPSALLVLVLLSHEFWRRVCPLAFVSQLFRALGRQRTVAGRGGRREVVRIELGSWLGQHHLQLQWGLFIAGLSLRLLLLNSHTVALGVFLLLTIGAAIVVGWAYGGKAWCQYFCPMGPVQSVITGPRSIFGSPAHLETSSRITQSMCRTIGDNGKEQSACVACQAPCIDIDSERVYWQNLRGKRGLQAIWTSYPGLVLGFSLLVLVLAGSREGVDYQNSAVWAYDALAALQILEPLGTPLLGFGLPRLLSVPLLLVLSGLISIGLFQALERRLERWWYPRLGEKSAETARQRTRLLASFLAINAFFWFADPSLGLAGPAGGQLIRSLVLIVSGMWLYRGWSRDRHAYSRESTSASLRKQLQRLVPELAPYLDGRSLEDLSPDEVFTLAKVLPVQISQTKRDVYRGVLADLFSSGRLERASAMVQLEELRQSLGLAVEDHHAALRELSITDPRFLQLDERQQALRNVRQEAAAEAIRELLELSGSVDSAAVLAGTGHRERLERIQRDNGLDDDSWQELMLRFGAASPFVRQRLEQSWDRVRGQLAARRSLELAADPRLLPLLPVMDRRLTSLVATVWSGLQPFPPEDPLLVRFAALLPQIPPGVRQQLQRRQQELGAAPAHGLPLDLEPLPPVADVLDELWQDPDPDTALWVLWVQDQRQPERAAALRRQPRSGLPSHQALQTLIMGGGLDRAERLLQLLQVPLVAGLSPGALIDMVRWGRERRLDPGEVLFRIGDPSDIVAILLEGTCQVFRSDGSSNPPALMATLRPGESIGEVAFFSALPRRSEVRAGEGVAVALVFDAGRFEELLHASTEFSHGLLRQLAMRVETLYSTLGPVSHPRR